MVRWTTTYLADRGFHNARLNAELLLAGVLRLKRLDLYLQFDRPLRADEVAAFKARLLRRVRREPLQYIEGEAAFRDLRLHVDRRVLIPRPETELLVRHVLDWARGRADLSAIDVGTGSGAIALALGTEGPFRRVVATDASLDALDVARQNHAAVAAAAPVEFLHGGLYEPVAGEQFDVIVSNPPYVALNDRTTLDAEVREWEPEAALFAGTDGLDVLRPLISGAPQHLNRPGLLALEIGHTQAAHVGEMAQRTGRFTDVKIVADLAGRERFMLAYG